MNNGEILYMYDAKLCNPNGDPDEENRPRFDAEREINLVSDLRIKRYVRDYLHEEEGKDIYVRKIEDKPVTAGERVKDFVKNGELDVENIKKELIDIRLFGATIPLKSDNKSITGPVQFNWGYSLNKVELMESSITTNFLSKERNIQGSIGKDYRVKYSFIAFSGVVSGRNAKKTGLTDEDLKLLDKAMKNAIPLNVTRTKINQYPRLYIRLEYKDTSTVLGDMRKHVKLIKDTEEESIRDISELKLDITQLIKLFDRNKSKIERIYYFACDELKLVYNDQPVELAEVLKDFNVSLVE